jgi:5'-methylthioadenosine phosphorylase
LSKKKTMAEIGIIGGSGLYAMAGFDPVEQVRVETPYGEPSDVLRVGTLEGRRVAFLARHGRNHRRIPTEINYLANIYAMKTLGVERILSASAVGSMREDVHPRDVLLPDQFIDRTRQRASTFFGDGVAAHVSFGDPVCPEVRSALLDASRDAGATAHDGGTYVCMEGPAFSTRAESLLYRSWGVDVIGMTNLQEAKLSREAEICYATLALVTDYDCWHEEEEEVSVEALIGNLQANSRVAARVLRDAVKRLGPRGERCGCADALQYAIITPIEAIPEETRRRLQPILGRYLK